MKVKTEAQERKESFVHMVFWATCCVYLVHILMGCTVKVDNPFYAPSTLDVNKNTSTGAANYLPKEGKKLTPGMAD